MTIGRVTIGWITFRSYRSNEISDLFLLLAMTRGILCERKKEIIISLNQESQTQIKRESERDIVYVYRVLRRMSLNGNKRGYIVRAFINSQHRLSLEREKKMRYESVSERGKLTIARRLDPQSYVILSLIEKLGFDLVHDRPRGRDCESR